MRGLACKDTATCWIGGGYGLVQRTTNGGASWQTLSKPEDYSGFLYSAIWTGTGSTALVGGSASTVLRSTDGINFSQIKLAGSQDILDLTCPAAGTCYAAGSGETVFRTANDGLTWTQVLALGGTDFMGVSCTGADTCWVAGSLGLIYRTTNAGGTWQRQQSDIPSTVYFNKIRMADSLHGYAVADGGLVYRTDNGQTWTRLNSFTSENLIDLYVFGVDDVFVIDWAGKVWHYGGTANFPTLVNRAATGVVLTWTHVPPYVGYQVWRGASPYFVVDSAAVKLADVPAPAISGQVAYTDTTAFVPAGSNYFYQVLPTESSGQSGAGFSRTGTFNFASVSGSP